MCAFEVYAAVSQPHSSKLLNSFACSANLESTQIKWNAFRTRQGMLGDKLHTDFLELMPRQFLSFIAICFHFRFDMLKCRLAGATRAYSGSVASLLAIALVMLAGIPAMRRWGNNGPFQWRAFHTERRGVPGICRRIREMISKAKGEQKCYVDFIRIFFYSE